MPDRTPLLAIHAHASAVWGVALSADGRLLATSSDDGTARLWDVPGARPLATLRGHTSTVMRVALSADGRVLASASGDSTVRLWEVPSGLPLSSLEGHTSTVFGVAVSADAGLLASGSGDGTVKLWETAGRACVRTLRNEPCYERLDITGMTGVTAAQREALLALGAIERSAQESEQPDTTPLPLTGD